jgi:hypothetical protein
MPKQKTTGSKGKGSTSPGIQKPKDSRIKSPPSPTSVVLAGALKHALLAHAFERCRHFFLYLYLVKALEYVSKKLNPQSSATALSALEVKATHQVDDGYREKRTDYEVFGKDDEDVVHSAATSFKETDAAHFCNLGIKPGFVAKLDLTNKVVKDLYESLKAVCGNTRWLPQLVNVGPDKKIDRMHGKLATEFLGEANKPACSRTRIAKYVKEATTMFGVYVLTKQKQKSRGMAACAKCYLEAYVQDDFQDLIYSSLLGSVAGWASATNNQDAEPLLISSL